MGERIAIIGGGAAGLMAAGRAAQVLREHGAEDQVLLLEKTPRLGNKLRITGKGRCNLTNESDVHEFVAHLGPNGSFFRNAAARFFVRDTIAFFNAHGVPTITERGRRVFPVSENADDVAEALYAYCVEGGVEIHRRSPVTALTPGPDGWEIRVEDTIIPARAVILATGGLSYPGTGSTGDGYAFAQGLGHTISPLGPGLVPLVSAEAWVPRLQGLSLRNVRATLSQGATVLGSEFGEMLFTHYGVSGPIILTLSSMLRDALASGPVTLCIDLKPALNDQVLDERLRRDLLKLARAHYYRLLKELLPSSLIDVFAEQTGIPLDTPLGQFTAAQRERVRRLLKRFCLTIVHTRPIHEAIITLGGVLCDEIVPQTMASRLHRGLYFAGEIIDIAGDTGGYNLQIAFTTGYLAGESAARTLLQDEG